jgi:hypothetical protein
MQLFTAFFAVNRASRHKKAQNNWAFAKYGVARISGGYTWRLVTSL